MRKQGWLPAGATVAWRLGRRRGAGLVSTHRALAGWRRGVEELGAAGSRS